MRASGILMHITSLPSPYGVGTLGKESYKFVDFLKKAGQQYWQILPLTPTGYGDSPYQSCSTYAGNHYLIDLDLLVEQGLLEVMATRRYEASATPSFANIIAVFLTNQNIFVQKLSFSGRNICLGAHIRNTLSALPFFSFRYNGSLPAKRLFK